MESVWRDLKYGLRTLARNPGFTSVAILSLALGIGANTAIFTLTNAVFLNPLPVADPARVMELFTVDHATTTTAPNLVRTPTSFPNYLDYRDGNGVFSGTAAYIFSGVTLTGRGDPKPQGAILVSANYFDVLGVKAALGRTFLPDEDRKDGGNTVTVLSHAAWMKLLGGDPAAIGKTVEFDSIPYTVIGVAPVGFKGTVTVANDDVAWIPISMHAEALPGPLEELFHNRRMRMIDVFGRLKPGVQQGQAEASLKTIAARLEREYPADNRGRTIELSSLTEAALGFLPRDRMVIAGVALTAVVGLVLLIACANLANLLLARSAKRAREMGIRTALGAERSRLIRQLLTENLLLSIAGGISGLLIGLAGSKLLWSFRPAFLEQNIIAIQFDWRVFAFTAAITLITGMLFGLLPALRSSLSDLSEVLKTGGRGGTESFARSRLRSALVVGEIALALVALAGAGLFIRSMDRVQKIDPGFETRNLFEFSFDIAPQHYTPEKGREFFRSALNKARETPGVRAAALASSAPMGGGILRTVVAEGQDADPNRRGTLILSDAVSPAYFETLRIPLRQGRLFTDLDRQGSALVAVVTEAMARHFWPGQSAIGKRFLFVNDKQYYQVVGVCANSVAGQIGEQPQPVAYVALDQEYVSALTLLVRTDASPEAVMPAVLKQVQSLNTNMALTDAATFDTVLSEGLWAPRMGAALFGIFGLLGMLLAAVGIYGVMAYMVAQRTNEIGLRMALGARPADVLRLVIGQGMRLAAAGIVLGILGGLAITHLMESLLFDVPSYDPLTFGGVTLLVAAAAFLAGWLPARRAARIDPLGALRQD
jgi:putative ABC transport system permease protein